MKFLEGKSPAERNKIIAAMGLGGLAVIALAYTLSGFIFSPTKDPKLAGTKTPTPSPTASRPSNGGDVAVSPDDLALLTTPVAYYPGSYSSDAGRNVFSFYEPPPPTPYSPTPYVPPVIKTPTPPPPPPILVSFMSPSSIYAGSKTFRMEVGGDKFTADSVILFNGSELPTNFISTQKLTADVPAVLISSDGGKTVMVRTPDGKLYSNQVMLQVQPPPVPNFEYIGLVEKKHRNNDMAMLREKGKTEVAGFRLNDTVGERFRLISISGREVILEDRSLGFKHRLPFSDGGKGGNTGGGGFGSGIYNSPSGRGGVGNQLPNQYQPYNPNTNTPQNPPGEFIAPGIPQNPNVRTNTNSNPTRQNAPPKKDYEDDNDDGNDR
jgi:hypothetical protein